MCVFIPKSKSTLFNPGGGTSKHMFCRGRLKRLLAVTYFKTHVLLRALEEVARCRYFKTHVLQRAAEQVARWQSFKTTTSPKSKSTLFNPGGGTSKHMFCRGRLKRLLAVTYFKMHVLLRALEEVARTSKHMFCRGRLKRLLAVNPLD